MMGGGATKARRQKKHPETASSLGVFSSHRRKFKLQNGSQAVSCPAIGALSRLQRNDVLGLWAFLALGHSELDFLAFSQGAEAAAGDSAEVRKHIRAARLLEEAKAF